MKSLLITIVFSFSLCACGNAERKSNTLAVLDAAPLDRLPTVKSLRQSELDSILQSDTQTVMIDVRTPSEISEGYIPKAALFIDYNGANFEGEIGKLDKSKSYIMYCRSGSRSGKAANYMVNHGFIKVYNLEGGILNYTGSLVK